MCILPSGTDSNCSAPLTDSDRVKALNEICRDVLVHISDETMLNRCLEPLAKEFGKLKLWRDALQRS